MATQALITTITPDLKERVLSEFWGITSSQTNKWLVEHYSEYYSKQVQLMLYDGGHDAPTWTHNDIVDVMTYVTNLRDRQDISSSLQSRLTASGVTVREAVVDQLIDLAARLCLMTSFGKAPFADERQLSVKWIQGNSKELLHQHFHPQAAVHVDPRFKLPKIFTARNVYRIGGIQIEWTPYLSEHLRLLDHDERVAIFHHVGFLYLHRKSNQFPPGFIDETLRTLALLFPRDDPDTKHWIQGLSNVNVLVRKCGTVGAEARKIENFSFWRDRLVVLKEAFDEAEPRSLSQLWFDRRVRVQWYTLWVAVLVFVLTIFFGLVQSVEGALQVYLAFRSGKEQPEAR